MKCFPCCLLLTCLISCGCGHHDNEYGESQPLTDDGSSTSAVPVAHAQPADLLDLRLRVEPGDRFPLIKTVEQQVAQQTSTGQANAVTRLELSLMIQVDEVTSDDLLMRVRYTRVHYAHNVDGHHTVYDSASPTRAIPRDAVPYAGLAGHGYLMRIGTDHAVRELIGHDRFLNQCLAHVPVERRASLMNEIAVRFGDEGVAGFVPDTLGLLPFNTDLKPELASRVQQGDSWKIERQLMQPVPVHVISTCRVVRITPATAEIDIAGRIIPGKTYQPNGADGQSEVRILGGTSTGVCVVDRPTGLPVDVQRQEMLNVQVVAPDGQRVSQVKRINTSVRMYPQERGHVVSRPASETGVIPASAAATTSPVANGVRRIPTSAPGSQQTPHEDRSASAR